MLSCSIVLYHSNPTYIEASIKSFLAYDKGDTFYLIDNSKEDNLRYLAQHEKVVYIHTKKNIGFGAGHNMAIRKSMKQSKYHLIINPDIIYTTNVLDEAVSYLEQHEEVGVLTPKILSPDGQVQHLCKLSPDPFIFLGRRFFNFLIKNTSLNHRFEMRYTGYDKVFESPFMSGCFMFFRNTLFEKKKLDLFDENIFLFCEDVDICRRAWDVCKTVFYPFVNVIHEHERKRILNRKILYYYFSSAIQYFNKWGWVFDKERRRINREALEKSGYYNI